MTVDFCTGQHETPVEATYTSPALLCDDCWFMWWTEGYTDEEREAVRAEYRQIVAEYDDAVDGGCR